MNDKLLMEQILYSSKVINDLLMHGVIEASNDKIMVLYNKAINNTLKLHNDIYKAMEKASFYVTNNVKEDEILKLKNKLTTLVEGE